MTENCVHQKVCGHCGFGEKDFAKSLRLGCPHCYEVFAPELATFLPRMHVGSTHVGKTPRQAQIEACQLTTALEEVEQLLASSLPSDQSDVLLEQWRDLKQKIEASSQNSRKSHENS